MDRLADALRALGLEWGVVAAPRYDAVAPPAIASGQILPGARSILVVASAGPVYFRAFVRDARANPDRHREEPHPLDAFGERTFAAMEPLFAEGGARFRRLSPAFSATPRLDFTRLGILAGLGLPSEIGLLVHPRYGPWIAFRQAIFTTDVLPDSAPVVRPMCDGCPAPCRAACPIGIVGPGVFDWQACSAARAAGDPCASRCDARLACIVGPDARYDDLQIRYHASPSRGREEILRM